MDREVEVVQEGVGLAEEAGSALREISDQVETVSAVIEQIATASEEQSVAADQISGDIETVARITRNTMTGSQQIVQASHEMAHLAINLQKAVSMFKISEKKASLTIQPTIPVRAKPPEQIPALSGGFESGAGGGAGDGATDEGGFSDSESYGARDEGLGGYESAQATDDYSGSNFEGYEDRKH